MGVAQLIVSILRTVLKVADQQRLMSTVAVVFLAVTCSQEPTIAATFNIYDATGLRAALLASATNGEDDLIVLGAGTYATGGTPFTFLTNENKTLKLQGTNGASRSQVVLDGGGTSQVLNFTCVGSCGAISLQSLTVQGGKSSTGKAAVIASTNLTISDVTFFGNSSGAITGSAISVSNSTFSANTAGNNGGAISGSTLTVANSTFNDNTVQAPAGFAVFGGAIFGSTVIVMNSIFSYNTAAAVAGGGAISGGTVSVANSTFSSNSAGSLGGAIYASGAATITNSTFTKNWTSHGGAVYLGAEATITDSTFSGNFADIGGAISAPSGLTTIFTNSIFSNNRATNGGGGAIFGSGIIVNNSFSGNAATGSGAAISVSMASSIINSIFYGQPTPAISATAAYNLYNNLLDTNKGIVGSTPIMLGNVVPGAKSPFVDAAKGNFRLVAGSGAIDTGLDPNSTSFANLTGAAAVSVRQLLVTDLQGNPRPTPGTPVDIGAYEYGLAAPRVVEFYNTILDHYFITADSAEANAVESGSAGPGWARTGNSFNVGGSAQVCRFYGSVSPGPNSHFYTALAAECLDLIRLQDITPATQKRWNFENFDFTITAALWPIPSNGKDGYCQSSMTPVYRAYNNGFSRGIDSNHRITSNLSAITEVVARGWISEGVVMCALQ